ncbi:MAG: DUF4906 domain-containing protein [Alistipes sp.]|nr:DUF4906 domain-containing protein [Alistipes sp.]
MKKLFNIFAIALASVLMFSCQEDADVDNFGHGGTVNGKFSLVVPSNEMVEITRATEEAESEVTNVYLFYFDEYDQAMNVVNGKNYEEIVLGTATQSGNYTRTYNVGTQAKFNDGDVVNIYAIANTSSSLGTIADFISAAGNLDKFEQLMMSLNTLNTPFSSMVMSGKLNVVASAQYGATGTIEVKRPYAKVNFTIKNGKSNYTFTPTQYNVKNVPTNGALFEGAKVSDLKVVNHDGMTDFVENQGAQVIEFFMLENLAGNAEGVASYNDREKRKDITGGKHSEFAHGLANATYVEIKGEGKGTNDAGEPISATVTYTIHLGDFANDATDFNVKRNHWYNYTVTVSGVNKIVVEAESEEMDDNGFQHGAEGTVINLEGSKMVYTLDAHYEQALLKLDLTKLPTDDNAVVMAVSTPFMSEENKGKMITWSMIEAADFGKNFDTEWVEFYPSNALCAYPASNANLMKTVDFLKYIKQQALNGVKELSVVAFINEYYYDENPLTGVTTEWPEFVNKEDRVMRILQEPSISADGHSISTKALCAFTQRSIRTVFNTNAEGRPFGIETYDETGAIGDYSSLTAYASAVTESKHGYGSDGQPNGNTYNALASQDAADACQQRNRAGSNVWKLATPSQYSAIWIGEQALPNDAKLYKGNPADNLTSAPGWNGSYSGVYQHWTSGGTTERIFWHVEGAALSRESGSSASAHMVRCVRDLNGETAATPNAESKDLNGSTAVVIKNFAESAYRGIATENLPVHNERDAANKVTKAFIIAKADLEATWTAMSDAPAAPQILSAEVVDGSLVIKFLNKDTYVYAKSNTTTISSQTNVVLGAENSVVINNPSGTYYFRTKRNYNVFSQYVTVTADGTINNTAFGTASAAVGINASTSATSSIPMMAAIYQDVCAQYTESANGTAWRVPNQKELLLIRQLGLDEVSSSSTRMISSTLFSARNLASTNDSDLERYGYTWYYDNWLSNGFGVKGHAYTGVVRCVRDASEAELEALGASNSGDMNEDEL